MPELQLDLNKAKEEIARRGARLVLVQLPEGLKQRTAEIIEELKGKETEVIALMDPCFGACDLALEEMKQLKADLLVHLGHSPIIESRNALHIPLHYKLNERELNEIIKKLIRELKKDEFKKIGLCSTIQYINYLDKIKYGLEKNDLKVFIGKGSGRIAKIGQVLGCNYSAVREIAPAVDAFVFFGDGLFHPLGIIFATEKPVVFANAVEGKLVDLGKERNLFLKKRFAAIAKSKEAESFGIIISTKSGQRRKQKAIELKKLVEFKGKKAFLFAVDFVREQYFLGVDVDCFVCTACPRIAVDDSIAWKKPLINPIELEIALGERSWEEFRLDELP